MRFLEKINILTLVVFITIIIGITTVFLSDFTKTSEKSLLKQNQKKEIPPVAWHFKQRAFPFDKINEKAYRNAKERVRELQRKSNTQAWTFSGPYNISGRITDIEVTNGLTLVSGTTGGIYRSTNGSAYHPIFDDQNNLSIGDMAIAPSDSSIIYVGTGDPTGNYCYGGDGVYKSTDLGETWEHIGLNDLGTVSKIQIHPNNPDICYVASMGNNYGKDEKRGVYKTINGGQTWEKKLYINDSTGIIEMVMNPDQPDTLYAVAWERQLTIDDYKFGGESSGIYRTYNGGESWEKLTTDLPTAASRIGFDIARSSPNILYAAFSDTIFSSTTAIYKSINYGDTWTQYGVDGIVMNSSYSYFGKLYVKPSNPNVLFYTNVKLYKSTNGGASWSESFVGTHVDHHTMAFSPNNSNHTYLGTDGGMYISYNSGNSYIQPDSIPLVQFYHCEIDQSAPERLYGGTQDNSIMRTKTGNDNDWEIIHIADGFYTEVDPFDNNFIYINLQRGAFARSTDGGETFIHIYNGLYSYRFHWNTPLLLSPWDRNVLYTAAEKVFKTNNKGDSWYPISGNLTYDPNETSGSSITTIALSKINENLIISGAEDGRVCLSVDTGATWNDISGGLPQRYVTRVLADKYDPNTIYVTFSGYFYGLNEGHVFKSTNLGESWTSISGDMPNVPVNSIIQIAPNQHVIATDVGVFQTKNGGVNWEIVGNNIPPLVFTDLDYYAPEQKLVACTFGKGMYSIILEDVNAIAEPNSSPFKLYPNPAKDNINIELTNLASHGTVEIIGMNGKIVLYEPFSGNNASVNISNLKAGNYIVKIRSNGKSFDQKLIISQ